MPFAVELARVTLMLAKELELAEARKTEDADGLLVFEKPLPLANLDAQILCADALFAAWPQADAIIGNPPYLGSRYLAKEHGHDYAQRLYARFPGVPRMADLCTHWFRLAHDALSPGGRAGLVGTNTIRQNESRIASLDYILENGGVITEAVSTQVWSGDAAVHVSIVNWEKGVAGVPGSTPVPGVGEGVPPSRTSADVPAASDTPSTPDAAESAFRRDAETNTRDACAPQTRTRRLTFQRGDSVDSPWETFELPVINSSLSASVDVSEAASLVANQKPKRVFQGQKPNHEGFFLSPDETHAMLRAHPDHCDVLFPYLIGRDLVEEAGPSRWVIDFAKRDVFEARRYPAAFDRIHALVMSDIVAKAAREKAETGMGNGVWARMAERWWIFERHRPECLAAIRALPRYIACSRVTKRPIFEFVGSGINPDTTIIAFPMADDYSFGVLQSGLHWAWFRARCSTLKADFRYTSDTVFDTFPWPQSPMRAQIAEVAAAAVALRTLRREVMGRLNYSLRALYRTLDDPGTNPLRTAHTRLDTAVRAAYGLAEKKRGAAPDPLAFLLALNLQLAEKEKTGQPITRPGLPLPESEHAPFLTPDCIRATKP